MNLGGIYKAGFYPYPPQALALTCQLLRAAPGAALRLLDPCAGEGEALAAIAAALKAQGAAPVTYGVELAEARAQQAATRLDQTLRADWFDTAVSTGSMSLLWCNPPYDFDVPSELAPSQRLEYTFLRASYDRLVPGGVLAYIVPRWTLGIQEVARLLAGHFHSHAVYRVPEYEQYKQVVLFAVKRPKAQADPATAVVLRAYATGALPPDLATATETHQLPAVDLSKKFVFYKTTLTPAEERDLAAQYGVLGSVAWADTQPRPARVEFTPAVPMRRGHVAMLVASGLLGAMTLGDTVARGYAVKVYREQKPVAGEPYAPAPVAVDPDKLVEREDFVTKVFAFDRQGQFSVVETQAALEGFLTTHAPAIARLIEQRHRPLYDKPDPGLWARLGRLMPHKRLPGRAEPGLLDAQKHVALAAATTIRARGYAKIVAEMGFGKTACSLATAEALDAWPALVLCPPHLVEKWAREASDVVPGLTATVIATVSDALAFARHYQPGAKAVAVLSREDAKLASGWRPATIRRTRRGVDEDGLPVQLVVHTCPRCGRVVTDAADVPLTDLPPKRQTCAYCREALYQYTRYSDQAGSKARWPAARFIRQHLRGFFRLLIADEVHQYKGKGTDQGAALQSLVQAIPWQVTLTGTLFGGKSVDLFRLLHRLDGRVRQDFKFNDENRWSKRYGRLERTTKKVAADAAGRSGQTRYLERSVEIPGVSPLIVERILPTVIFAKIADLGYALPPFDEQVVRLDMTPDQGRQYHWLADTLLDLHQAARQQRDLGLLSVWLQNALARPNSAFRTEAVVRGVGQGKQRLVVPVCGPLPDGGTGPLVLPPQLPETGWLPKEAWLASFAQSESAQGRKVLVYARQTGTRDIQPRLQAALHTAGLRATVLPATVDARQREAWIAAHMDQLDVLITNPKKVETGLDLVQFATIVFAEIEYSLPSFWQAMRRVWRLGQTQPVRVVYAVYRNTLEEAGLALMGRKFKAAALLYGDNAASAISDDADDGGQSFLTELAARVLGGELLTVDGMTGLVGGSQSTGDAWGSFTRTSPELAWQIAWLLKQGIASNVPFHQIARPRDARRAVRPTAGQLALLDPA